MSPKIEIHGPQGPAPGRSRGVETPSATGASDKAAAPVVPTDSVKLTDDALRLQRVAQAAAEAPAVDLKRVADVRERLREGRYEIRPDVIAERLVRLEWELAAA